MSSKAKEGGSKDGKERSIRGKGLRAERSKHNGNSQPLPVSARSGSITIPTVRTGETLTDKEKDLQHKIAPTAEQLRIAHMIDNSGDSDKVNQEKVNQVVQITSVSSDEALVALHDSGFDVNAAVDSIMEGDGQGMWTESKKKKKAPVLKDSELETNKENRQGEARERSNSRPRGSGAPRFRSRGAGRGGLAGEVDGPGRGGVATRGWMTNGGGPSNRGGRGGRGRGAATGVRTFQNSTGGVGFPDAIETWGTDDPVDDKGTNVKIDSWDEQSGSAEDWDNEWTGSLDQTTVFGPSTASAGGGAGQSQASSYSNSLTVGGPPGSQQQPPVSAQSYSAVATAASAASMMQAQQIDLAALLQQAAPQSTITGLGTTGSSVSMVVPSSLGGILGGLGGNVSNPLKMVSSGASTYSNSMFSNSGLHANVSNSLSNVETTMSLSSTNCGLPVRPKPQRGRSMPTSKIPLSAVEMPEDTMSGLDVQFGGLEFGTETLDLEGSKMGSGSHPVGIRDGNCDMGVSMASGLTQQQASKLGLEPIPYQLSQNAEHKSSGSGSAYGSQRGGVTSQGLSDLTKGEGVGGANTLGSLVGSASSYQSYPTSKASSFPSPPSAPYSHTSSQQQYSGSGSQQQQSGSYGVSTATTGNSQYGSGYSSSQGSSTLASAGSNQYSNSYSNVSSHSSLSSMVPTKSMGNLSTKEQSQQAYSDQSPSMTGSLSSNNIQGMMNTSTQQSPHTSKQSHQGVQPMQQSQHLQQQQTLTQHAQFMQAAPMQQMPFYNVQPPMYPFDEFQLLQQRMPHMQVPTSLATGRGDTSLNSGVYSTADAKFRTDQNSSPVASTMNQQGGTAAGAYITATGNAGMPFYMPYQNMAMPNSFTHYTTPTIIQLPPVTNAASNLSQFPAAPKLQNYSNNYYDTLNQQTQDYKTGGYGTNSQNQSKPNSSSSASNTAADLSGYKNHLSKSYDNKQYHTGTPPPFNMVGSASNQMAPNFTPAMFIPTMQPGPHHSTLIHHQLHQDGTGSGGQRSGASVAQNKGGSKGYAASYWGN